MGFAEPKEVSDASVLGEPYYHLIVHELRSQDSLLAYEHYLLRGYLCSL